MINIYRSEEMTPETKEKIFARAGMDIQNIQSNVEKILDDIKNRGDAALREYTKQFDGADIDTFRVTKEEIDRAFEETDDEIIKQIERQISYARKFHEMEVQKDWETELSPGVTAGVRYLPIEAVGLYVPGGRATYPTVMQILGVAACTANVPRIVACTPPDRNGKISGPTLVAARLSGVDEVYKLGGIQAIGAMAYGSESIKPVYKISGPGNIYVTCAKKLVYGTVDIDMLAGPSEAVILADGNANPRYVAIDIIARCEHDPNAAGVLITDSMELAEKVKIEIGNLFNDVKRREIIEVALQRYSAIIVAKDMDEAIALTNEYAAEHLEVIVDDPKALLPRLNNGGSVFLGEYAPVAIGDYASGTNHVLPTGKGARMFSAVSVSTFQKASEYQYLTKEGLKNLNPIVQTIAAQEGLDAHALSVKMRLMED